MPWGQAHPHPLEDFVRMYADQLLNTTNFSMGGKRTVWPGGVPPVPSPFQLGRFPDLHPWVAPEYRPYSPGFRWRGQGALASPFSLPRRV